MADSKIELRSEKVRHIIGEIPSGIVRYGITIITIVILVLLVGAYFIPYPETISAKIEMTDRQQGTVDIPYKYVNTVKMHTPRQTAAGNVFTAQVKVTDCKYKIIGGMTGTASILVSNESVLQRILQRITNIM